MFPETRDPLAEDPAEGRERRLAGVLETCLAEIEAGRPLDDRETIARHPDLAERLKECLPALLLLQEASTPSPAPEARWNPLPAGFELGDFRILREIGRGGMGVVYEAEQPSLSRRVALKVLPSHLTLQSRSVSRFQQEAATAARLRHPGIVPIFAVGEHAGTHYFAMELVEGAPLDRVLAHLRNENVEDLSVERLASAVRATTIHSADTAASDCDSGGVPRAWGVNYVQAVCRIAIDVAEALHHAHERGVVHRDVKPSNVLVRGDGSTVLTDFGLARAEANTTLTRSGELAGTPSYVSPEQALGKRGTIDHRTDIFSLGSTLYELLTLRRPFVAPNDHELVSKILHAEAPPPHRWNRRLPPDLETILDKALEKDPGRRYQTAAAFAEDLRAAIEGRPILARRIGRAGRVIRWSKREPAKASLLLLALVSLPTIAALVTSHIKDRPEVEAARLARLEEKKDELLAEAAFLLTDEDAGRAQAIYEEVLAIDGTSADAAGGLVMAHLHQKDPAEALRLLDVHRALLGDGAAALLMRATALEKLDRLAEAHEVAKRVPPPRTALDHAGLALQALRGRWTGVDEPSARRALMHATAAILLSPNPSYPFYDLRALAAVNLKDRDAVLSTVAALRAWWPRSPFAMFRCGWALAELEDPSLLDGAIDDLREAIRLNPAHALAHGTLGMSLMEKGLIEAAIPEFREAIRLDPGYALAHNALGVALGRRGDSEGAIFEFREAIRLKPDIAEPHMSLGFALMEKGWLHESLAELREAVELKPGLAEAHSTLGKALARRGLLDAAIAAFGVAIRLNPADAESQSNLDQALTRKASPDGAVARLREVVRLNPSDAETHDKLGIALERQGLFDDAVAAHREATRLKPDWAMAHTHLGYALARLGLFDDAIEAHHEAIRLKPDLVAAHKNLGYSLAKFTRLDGAIRAYREALRLDPAEVEAHGFLGTAFSHKGLLDEAVASYRKAIQLKPDYAASHYGLGETLRELGQFRESLVAFRRSAELGWPDSKKRVEKAEARVAREVEREQQLAGHVLAGTKPDDAQGLVTLARVALEQGHHSLAARWYLDVLEPEPKPTGEVPTDTRCLAARAAIRTAAAKDGSGADLDGAARTSWRLRALAWLEAEVTWIRDASEARTFNARQVRITLLPVTRSTDFTAVRDPAALDQLPVAERERWTKLWAGIEALLKAIERE